MAGLFLRRFANYWNLKNRIRDQPGSKERTEKESKGIEPGTENDCFWSFDSNKAFGVHSRSTPENEAGLASDPFPNMSPSQSLALQGTEWRRLLASICHLALHEIAYSPSLYSAPKLSRTW